MKLFPNGDRVFEVINRYDDLLALEEREGSEPGDTLALIVPFLVLNNISTDDITSLAAKAFFTDGAEKLISWLQFKNWRVFCIATAYEQYAIHITRKLGIYAHNLASTSLSDLTEVLKAWQKGKRSSVEKVVKKKAKAGGTGDTGHFHWLSGRKDIHDVIEIHKRIRRLVRKEAGKLG